MYVTTEIMFPSNEIGSVRDSAGAEWRGLVEGVTKLEETDPASLAFVLMMIRLNGCLECETDSYRALRGCAFCAQQSVRRFRRNERELLKLYRAAAKDMNEYLEAKPG
jgi:hypothetical protein